MGATQSKVLEDLTTEEVSAFVSGLGKKGQYASYADSISSNAVDGEVLASIEEDEMKETMECLSITNFLHQKVLIKEWHKAKLVQPTNKGMMMKQSSPTQLQRMETGYTADCGDTTSEITMDANMSLSGNSPYVRKLQDGGEATPLPVRTASSSVSASSASEHQDDALVTRIPMRITVEHKQAIEPLQLPKSLELLPPESQELEPFRQIAGQALHDFQGAFAEVNLLDTSHMEDKPGLNNLAFIRPDQPPIRHHQDAPTDMELCRKFILAMDEDFYMEELPLGEFGLKEPARYYTHVVRIGDIRVGTVCCVLEESNFGHTTGQQKLEILKFLASVAERQFQRRQVLLERNQNLRHEIEHLKQAGVDQVLAEPYGPVRAVRASQVAARHSLFPYPTETEDSSSAIRNNGSPTDPSRYSRRSAGLLSWHSSQQATYAERSHIPSNYYDHPAFHHGAGMMQMMDRTPIGKRDMERVALINSLGLLQLDPLSKEAQAIQQLVEITGTLLGAELALVTLLDHQNSYLFFPTLPQGPESVSPRIHTWLESHELIQRHPQTGEPFVLRGDRCDSLCNYTISCPHQQAFVVHDVARDQSVARLKETTGMGFYSGAPIVLRGLTVGGLCIMGRDPRPTFGRVQELQQEQLAQMIAQQYESWALGREMKKLERERRLMMGNPSSPPASQSLAKMRSNRPERYAALVFTSIEGMDALQASPALKTALGVHNGIVFSKIADNGGYEVLNENGAFHVAFCDVVNAVNFCLRTQEALHSAPWGDDLLTMPEACVDPSKKLRGLRVKMTIHCGDVELTTVPLSGKMAYTGETYHVAKSLEGVCHGGQILVTSDVWNVASEVVESSLGSPQVLDLGSHVLPSQSGELQDGITVSKILQLVPKTLAHDYVSGSRQSSSDAVAPTGRVFPPISTEKSVGASFHNAPNTPNHMVSMVFVDTSCVEAAASTNPDAGLVSRALAKRIDSILKEGHPQGYQCHQDFLIAFEESADAVRFGLAIQENLNKEKVLDMSLANQVKIGVQEGLFESMGPNPISGKAEYFGRVVKDVTMTAADTAPGCVYLGREPSEWDQFNVMQPVSNGFMLDFVSRKYFENDIENEFVLFKCQPCKSWYDQIIENRSGRHCQSLQTPWRNYQ